MGIPSHRKVDEGVVVAASWLLGVLLQEKLVHFPKQLQS